MIGYVFMSYSRRDEESMRFIAKFLRAHGFKVWVDNEKLIPGTPVWEEEVEKAIRGTSAVVVLLSPDSKKSDWVRRETSLADQHQKRVFPVLVSGDENSSITLRLINRQYVDIRENKEIGLNSLSAALSFYLTELDVHEKKPVEESRETGHSQPGYKTTRTENEKGPNERVLPKTVEQSAIGKTDQKSTERATNNGILNWLMSGTKGEAKRLIGQLADVTKRDRAGQDLIRLGADSVPALLDALQTRDLNLLPYYQQVLARIPSASPALIKMLSTAHPILRGRAADVFAISKDKAAVPALFDALQGEYFTVRSRAALAMVESLFHRRFFPMQARRARGL